MVIVALLCALTAAITNAAAQSRLPGEVPFIFRGALLPLQPPDEPGAWQLQVITRGGIGGGGTGDFAITSTGSITVFAPQATGAVKPDALGLLRDLVSTSTPSQWSIEPKVSLCSDCVSTLIALSVRTPAGGVETYTAVWDPTMKARVSRDAIRIYDLALSLRQALGR